MLCSQIRTITMSFIWSPGLPVSGWALWCVHKIPPILLCVHERWEILTPLSRCVDSSIDSDRGCHVCGVRGSICQDNFYAQSSTDHPSPPADRTSSGRGGLWSPLVFFFPTIHTCFWGEVEMCIPTVCCWGSQIKNLLPLEEGY